MELDLLLSCFKNRLTLYNKSENTINGYIREIKLGLQYFNRDPKTITVEKWIEYFCTLEVYKRKTAIAAMKSFYLEIYNSTKLAKLRYPDLPEHIPNPLAVEEVKKLIAVTENLKHQTITMCMYTSGMRVAEVVKIKWIDISRLKEVIYVRNGKGAKDRAVPLPPSMVKQFEKYCKAYGLKCFNSNDYVFQGMRKGTPYSKRSVAAFLERNGVLAGIRDKVTPHRLRHSFAVHTLERMYKKGNVDLLKLREDLGHASLETTNIYTKVAKRETPDLMA